VPLLLHVRPDQNQMKKSCFNKKAGFLFNKNRFSITLSTTVQIFRQIFSPRKKDINKNIFFRGLSFMAKHGYIDLVLSSVTMAKPSRKVVF
jgi:hypothetical protein